MNFNNREIAEYILVYKEEGVYLLLSMFSLSFMKMVNIQDIILTLNHSCKYTPLMETDHTS